MQPSLTPWAGPSRLLALPAAVRAGYDVSSLRMVAHSAAPTPIELKRQMMDWWGPIIWETYGGTEGAATICKPHHWLAKPGTVGRPVRDARITILDEEDKPCRPGTPGRIFVERAGPSAQSVSASGPSSTRASRCRASGSVPRKLPGSSDYDGPLGRHSVAER